LLFTLDKFCVSVLLCENNEKDRENMTNTQDTLFKSFEEIVLSHIKRYGISEIKDLYKLIYQAAMGPEHNIRSVEDLKKSLESEMADMGKPLQGEALIEIIDPMSKIVRVNLRIYKGTGGTASGMANLFYKSAKRFKKDYARLLLYRDYLFDLAQKGKIPFDHDKVKRYWNNMEKKNFPAVHHSLSYAEKNRPAYRVVLKELLDV